MSRLAATVLLSLAPALLAAEDVVPFDSDRWILQGESQRLEQHLGRPALRLQGAEAVLGDLEIRDGVLEVDIAFGSERGFSGAFWRRVAPGEQEEFYLRPHQSGNADANQYTPVFHGLSAWQLYHGPAYAAAVRYRFDQWQHLRIVFSGGRAAVFLDSEEPLLVIPELKREPAAGRVGVYANRLAPAWFSRFRVRPLDDGEGVPEGGVEMPAAAPGSILTWEVSDPISAARLADRIDLPGELLAARTWTSIDAEPSGVVNLARLAALAEGRDTVLARTTLAAPGRRAKRIRFGYSDDSRVYLDGRLIYGGTNRYRSRDYRYLGTIGLFDEIYLDVGPGEHELMFAVTERFGGWGIQAVVEDLPEAQR